MTFVRVLDTISGQVGDVPEEYLTHPLFSQYLVPVEASQKPYNPNFYQPKSAEEFVAARTELTGSKLNDPSHDDEDIDEEETE